MSFTSRIANVINPKSHTDQADRLLEQCGRWRCRMRAHRLGLHQHIPVRRSARQFATHFYRHADQRAVHAGRPEGRQDGHLHARIDWVRCMWGEEDSNFACVDVIVFNRFAGVGRLWWTAGQGQRTGGRCVVRHRHMRHRCARCVHARVDVRRLDQGQHGVDNQLLSYTIAHQCPCQLSSRCKYTGGLGRSAVR